MQGQLRPLRRDRWQRVIDALLGVSGRLAAPALTRHERLLVEALSSPPIGRSVRHLADARLPRKVLVPLISAYIKLYDVDMSEVDTALEDFETFNDFFTRPLRSGARPIAQEPALLVSPADALIKAHGLIDPRGRIPQIKGQRFSVDELLARAAPELIGGHYAVLYLSPRDYHRVHCPAAGTLRSIRWIDGRRYPVNELGVRHIASLLARNVRTVFTIDSDDHGPIEVVMVGAANVSRITTTAVEGSRLAAGDELGTFNLGSTVVVLAPASVALESRVYDGETVKMGLPLYRVSA